MKGLFPVLLRKVFARYRQTLQSIRSWLGLRLRIASCLVRQRRILMRIRAKPQTEKIRVLFLNSEPSKWKCQSVYEDMDKSGLFEPMVGITALGLQSSYTDDQLEAFLKQSEQFFDSLGDNHARTVSSRPRLYEDLEIFSPDIVFFPEPWSQKWPQTTERISHYALLGYVPYYVPTHIETEKHCLQETHRYLTWYFLPNKQMEKAYRKETPFLSYSYRFVSTGHPALDFYQIAAPSSAANENNYVIYAPHFSVCFPTNALSTPISTFLTTGKAILEYAKSHREMKWLFKPHPKLRSYLSETAVWSKEDVDIYYNEWESIGDASYDGNYQKYFLSARALITDCDSFLAEFAGSGKPVIHLVRTNFHRTYAPYLQPVVDAYYRVDGLDEMRSVFKMVLEEAKDPLQEKRLEAIKSSGLSGIYAARNIVEFLRKELRC